MFELLTIESKMFSFRNSVKLKKSERLKFSLTFYHTKTRKINYKNEDEMAKKL